MLRRSVVMNMSSDLGYKYMEFCVLYCASFLSKRQVIVETCLKWNARTCARTHTQRGLCIFIGVTYGRPRFRFRKERLTDIVLFAVTRLFLRKLSHGMTHVDHLTFREGRFRNSDFVVVIPPCPGKVG